MSLKVYKSKVSSQLGKLNKSLIKDQQSARALKSAIRKFTSDVALQGDGYKNAKSYFSSIHVQILSQLIAVCDMLKSANDRYGRAVQAALADAEDPADQAKWEREIRELEKAIAEYEKQREHALHSAKPVNGVPPTPEASQNAADIAQGLQGQIDALKKVLKKTKERLFKLLNLESSTSSFYAAEEAALNALSRNINTLASSPRWDAQNGRFRTPKLDLASSEAAIANAIFKGKLYDVMHYCGDPINTVTGNYIYEKECLKQKGIAPFSLVLFYNSADDGKRCLGSCGWTHNHHIFLLPAGDEMTICLGDGREEVYELQDETYVNTFSGNSSRLKKMEDGYQYVDVAGIIYTFDGTGTLLSRLSSQGNGTTYSYDMKFRLAQVTSTAGGGLTFSYDDEDRIVFVQDQTGRQITFSYENGCLCKLTNEAGNAFTYRYNEEKKIRTITNPRGIVTVQNTYDGNDRMIRQEFPDGGVMEYEYKGLQRETVFTQQNGNVVRHLYDEKGRSTKIISCDGEETITYDEQNQKTSITDQNGNTTQFAYDEQGNLIRQTDALGQVTEATFSRDNLPTSTGVGGQILQTMDYDSRHNLTKLTDGIGRSTEFRYNRQGQPVEIIQADGSEVELTYDEKGNLIKMTDAAEIEIRYQFDERNRVIATIDGNENETQYAYDERDNLTKVTNALGETETYTYDKSDQVIEVTHFDGNTTKTEYNQINRPCKITDQNGNETILQYDKMWNVEKVTDSNGGTALFWYDKRNRLTSVTDPEGRRTGYAYDPNGNRIKIIDPMRKETTIVYDALNRVIEEIDPNGASIKMGYDFLGNINRITDPLGNSTRIEYDLAGQKTKETDLLGNSTTYSYTALGELETVTDDKGRRTRYEYYPGGLLAKTTYPDGTWESYTYDGNRNLIVKEEPENRVTRYTYDALDQLISVTDPLGNTSRATYDLAGNVASMTDGNGNVTRYSYSPTGELLKVTDPLGYDTSYDYDRIGNLMTIRQMNHDQKSLIKTSYERNKVGQVTKVTDALGNMEHYSYDKRGELKEKIDRDGYKTNFEYDAVGSLSQVAYADGKSVKYKYNPLRQLMELTDWLGTTKIERDQFGREISITDHRGNLVGYEWNEENQRIKTTYPDGSTAEYVYDELSRLKKLNADGHTACYIYDESSQLIEKTTGNIKTQYLYSDMGQIETLTHSDKEGILDQYRYQYDGVGNKVGIEKFRRGLLKESGSYTYGYDPLNRLEKVEKDGMQQSLYQYDAFGNRTNMVKGTEETQYRYNELNQLIQSSGPEGEEEYRYDKRGNLTKLLRQGEAKQAYQFDAQNHLEKATNQAGQKAVYRYNGLGFRVQKVELDHPERKIKAVMDITKQYNNLLQISGAKEQTFFWDGGPVFMKEDGNAQIYLQEELGSPIRLMDGAGRVSETYGYDAFGCDLYANQDRKQPFGYTGYQFDAVADTYFAQAREYMPQTGRFTGQDIVKGIVEEPDTLNPYVYCWNNPLGFIDLNGEEPVKIGHIYVAQGIWNGEYQTYTGSTAQELKKRFSGHKWKEFIRAETTTVNVREVTADLDIKASNRGTIRGAKNEALRSAEQQVMKTYRNANPKNQVAAAVKDNVKIWRERHQVTYGDQIKLSQSQKGAKVKVRGMGVFAIADLYLMARELNDQKYVQSPYVLEDENGIFTLGERRDGLLGLFKKHYYKQYQDGKKVEISEIDYGFWREEARALWGYLDIFGNFVPGLLLPELPEVNVPTCEENYA